MRLVGSSRRGRVAFVKHSTDLLNAAVWLARTWSEADAADGAPLEMRVYGRGGEDHSEGGIRL